MKNTIRQIYFYAATLIFLIMSVIATISLLNLGLKTFVFTKADMAYNSCDYIRMKPAGVIDPTTAQPAEADLAAQEAACEENMTEQRAAQRQRDLVQWLSMLIVAAPLFALHFKWVQKERETELKMNA